MRVGIPKETMIDEYRVGLLPEQAKKLILSGHQVTVESNAGDSAGCPDQMYVDAGCELVSSLSLLYEQSELIIKVKAPNLEECSYLTSKHIIFSFLHLASNKVLVENLLKSKCMAIAYESVKTSEGLPILKTMSEIAGQLAIQFGANCLMYHTGGKGILVGKVGSESSAKIIVLGAGIVGRQAILVAHNMQSNVVVMDVCDVALDKIKQDFDHGVKTCIATSENIERAIVDADLIIGAALIRDDKSPRLISREQLRLMQVNTVLVDVSIDQGGCFETSSPSTHGEPSYLYDGIIHCCISNLPGCVPITASRSLCSATFPYIQQLADLRLDALKKNEPLLHGVNMHAGSLTNEIVGKAVNLQYISPHEIIN